MKLKKMAALMLAMLFLLPSVPALAAGSSFGDITDTETAQNVEILQMLDVINGVSQSRFDPEGTLTRAQFTKMAVMIMERGEQASAYQNYTIFPDVRSSHWASGFVNLAVRGEEPFISGFADGTFQPDATITYGQAVTILMRMLGYADEDVGVTWPTGYLTSAASIGLTDGLSLGGDSALTRAQASKLFVNLLGTSMKGSATTFGREYAARVLEDVIILNASVTTDDGSPALETSKGEVKIAGSHVPQLIQGQRGELLLNDKGEVKTFLPGKTGSAVTIVVSSAKSGTITDRSGTEYTLTGTTTAYYKGEETTYGEIFINLRAGTQVTLHFGVTGKVESVIVADSSSELAVVVGQDGTGTFTSLTGGRSDYTIYRQGELVSPSSLRTYDVATYLSGENQILISTTRLTGYYENAYPNAEAPTSLTMMGCEFDVLPSAVSSLSRFRVGDSMTILLTNNFQVAGAVDPKVLTGNAVGVAQVTNKSCKVDIMEGLTLSGFVQNSNPANFDGLLVSVTSKTGGELFLVPIKEKSSKQTLLVQERRYGTYELASDVAVYERVSTGPIAEISLDDIRSPAVLQEDILHVRFNDNGKVDLLILDNVTGDQIIYGRIRQDRTEVERLSGYNTDEDGLLIPVTKYTYEYQISVLRGSETFGPVSHDTTTLKTNDWGGIVVSAGARESIVREVKLTQIRHVTNEDWLSEEAVRVNDTVYAVSDDVVCYNKTTGQWVSLVTARAFGDSMSLYVDDFHVVRGVEVGT